MRILLTVLAIAVAECLVSPAVAQQVEITAPTPPRAREPVVITPGDHYQVSRPSDADRYPNGPRVRPDPGFVAPLSSSVLGGTGRAGVAGWTAPNTPVATSQATGFHDVTGWFVLGLAFEWGGPPPQPHPQPTRRPPAR